MGRGVFVEDLKLEPNVRKGRISISVGKSDGWSMLSDLLTLPLLRKLKNQLSLALWGTEMLTRGRLLREESIFLGISFCAFGEE